MSSNSIAISRDLLAAGMEQAIASAVAEAIVKHSDDRNATKVEILELEANLKDEINALRNQLNTFQAETRAEFRAARAESKALREKMDAEAKKNDSRFNLLTIIVVIGILAPYIERAFGG